jgi:hypothetical protein
VLWLNLLSQSISPSFEFIYNIERISNSKRLQVLVTEKLDKIATDATSASNDVPGWDNSALNTVKTNVDQSAVEPAPKSEKFALYGFQLDIPDNWRIEVNPKSTRQKGDVAFHSPKGNRFFVSWGKLEDASKRFRTLEEHRDRNLKQIKKGQDVRSVDVGQSYETQLSGHKALFTEVRAEVKQGMFGRATYVREMWSVHLYCENRARYFVIYCLLRDPAEYDDYSKVFKSMATSLVCH